MSFGPFVMVLGVLESRGVGATFAFEIIKKSFLTKKWEHKTFCVIFFITHFDKIFFRKKYMIFFKISKNQKICKFSKNPKIFQLRNSKKHISKGGNRKTYSHRNEIKKTNSKGRKLKKIFR